jgi:predicted nucleic acid-binding protein
MVRVFIDSGMLIAAFRGEPGIRESAFVVLSDPNLEFWYSPLVRLEVILKPTYHRRKAELAFYEEYFSHANCFGDLDRIFEVGGREAMRHGIAVVDALHVAAAHLSRCAALVTTEKPTRPIFRTSLVRVVGISTGRAMQQSIHRLFGA